MTADLGKGGATDRGAHQSSHSDGYDLAQDSGLQAVVTLARCLDLATDAGRLRHTHGKVSGNFGRDDILRSLGRLGIKARPTTIEWGRLALLPLPAILCDVGSGSYMVAVRREVRNGRVGLCVGKMSEQDTCWIDAADAARRFTPGAILAARDSLPERAEFGVSWFTAPLGRYMRNFGHILAASLILQAFALVGPLLFQKVIDDVLISRGLQSLDVLAIGLLVIALFDPVMSYARSSLFTHMASCIASELSGKMFRHLIHLPVSYFRNRRAGDILDRIRELDQVKDFITGSALVLIIDLLFVIVFVSVMFAYAPALAGFVIGSLVLYVLIWIALSPLLRRRAKARAERHADATAHLTETVSGIETIKSLNAGRHFARDWEEKLAASLASSFSFSVLGTMGGGVIGLVQKLAAALILWFGVKLVMRGDLTVGELIAFNMLAGHVTMPVLRLAQLWHEFQHTGISLRRLGDILRTETETLPSAGNSSFGTAEGTIDVRQVTFRYRDDGPEVLRQLSLSVRAGEAIGITGFSGSGKSTLTRLVQRLYVPQSGQILIDGLDLAMADPVALRRRMGVVLQENFLFAGTIRTNIAMGCPGAGEARVRHAAQLAGAEAFIQKLPNGYETEVGERGGLLSGGQRQRIALARALVADPQILILDEATSALDYDTEAAILERLPDILKGRTALIIAHRLNSLIQCDRILVMERGAIVEEGRHDHLLKARGRYARLWEMQNA